MSGPGKAPAGVSARELSNAWKRVPWNAVFRGEVVADHIFLRSGLIRKDLLPAVAGRHMPVTYRVCSAEEAGRAAAAFDRGSSEGALNPDGLRYDGGGPPAWVIKPSDSSNAYGVHYCSEGEAAVRRAFAAAQEATGERDAAWVLQRSVPCFPLRAGGGGAGAAHRFHLRGLMLLAGDLSAYAYKDMRVLVAPEAHEAHEAAAASGGTDHLPPPHAFITNQSFNRGHAAYIAAAHNVALSKCEALACGGDAQGLTRLGGVLKQLRGIVADVARGVSRPKGEGEPRRFYTLPNCYELFGVDALLDATGRLVLLEVNPAPSMAMWGVTREELLRGRCPVADGVGEDFAKVFSKRLDAMIRRLKAAARERRREGAAADGARGGGEAEPAEVEP